ncbi:hypothetical protein CBS101457_006396 [Exobasidium rhododendri]|nr:hypothetical protein CBS101457_006396 [Exobasidium rhododendri]
MPGIKRKAGSSSARNMAGRKLSHVENIIEAEDEDDFDDEKDLMADAMANGGDDKEVSSEGEGVEAEYGKGNGTGNGEVEMFSDEDMEGGFEDVTGPNYDEEADPNSSDMPHQTSLYAIPSRDEMSALKNTSELYKSNIFKLKIEKMVAEVRPKYEKSGALDYVLRQIKFLMDSLPSIEQQPLKSAVDALAKTFKTQRVQVPFPDPQPKQESPLKFGFEKPSRVEIAGSWILKTAALRPEGTDVDMVLTMPSSLFQEKDYLNMRYFYKRAFYLSAIAAAIQGDRELGVDCRFGLHEEDMRRPFLILHSTHMTSQKDFTKLKAFIKIHLAHEPDLFVARRLSPTRNNIRMEGYDEADQPATLNYNTSILSDGLYSSHLYYLNSTSQLSGSFAEACMLLKTWALQRMFGSGPSKGEVKGRIGREKGRRIGLGSGTLRFLLSMILAHLLHGPEKTTASSASNGKSKLSPSFSSFQLFKGTIDFLALHDFTTQPVFMKAIDSLLSRRDKIDSKEFVQPSKAVLVDPTGSINLLQIMPNGTFALLQAEAKVTLAMLNDAQEDHFDEIFLRDRSKPSFEFDQVINVDLKGVKGDVVTTADAGSSLISSSESISQTLKRALNNRATLITIFRGSATTQWSFDSPRPRQSHKVEIGIMFNATQAFRLVDHGPRPEDTIASEAYKAFWGDLAELRRFRDGRIVESVVWSVHAPLDRSSIPQQIIRHILHRHHNLQREEIVFHSEAFLGLLSPNEKLARQAYLTLPSEGAYQTVQNGFDEVVKSLRELEGLPLSLISVVGVDAGLRSMSVMIPCPVNINTTLPGSSSYLPVQDFVITLESSGRWPDDLVAIQAMKMAFYETMATKLVNTLSSCKTAVVLDKDAEENKYWDCSSLEIILSSGLVYRGRIHHERERILLHRIIDDKDEEGFNKSQAKNALERFEIRFDHNVRHHNHMNALYHRFNALGEAVRLFKRWVSAQMLGMDVPEEVCELFVASVFIQRSEGDMIPSMGHTGFIQSLHHLASWNWRESPLAVPMTGATSSTPVKTFTADAKAKLQVNFEQLRRLDPGLNHFAWYIATESEMKGSCWGKNHPTSSTADALQRLARGACDILTAGPNLSRDSIKSLFIPSLAHFDFIVHLEPAVVNRYLDQVNFSEDVLNQSQSRLSEEKSADGRSKYRNLQSIASTQAGLNVGREFVQLLSSLFLDSMRLYYDDNGGIVIGGLFNPSLSRPRAFRVGLGFNSMPCDDTGKEITLNKKDVLAEIERLGSGIIQRVEWQRSK